MKALNILKYLYNGAEIGMPSLHKINEAIEELEDLQKDIDSSIGEIEWALAKPDYADEFANWCYINTSFTDNNPLTKYGEWILDGQYLLTNFRAVIYLKENFKMDFTKHFNTEFECEIIKQHFKVFNYKVDLPTRSQMVRHRCSWQELSRRYVSGERVPFEFYVSEKMKNIKSLSNCYGYECTTENIIDICLDHYKQALKQGVKPQEARRIIPQAAYTQIWGAFQPKQLDNYFKLRLDEHSQWEIRQTAIAMQELIQGDK